MPETNLSNSLRTDLNRPPLPTITQRIAGWFAASPFLARGRKLYDANCANWYLSMSKFDKVWAGGYVILKDYGAGVFPPTFDDQAKAYKAEIDYYESMPGVSLAENREAHMRKPFWGHIGFGKLITNFTRFLGVIEELGLKPKHRLLELGCGSGWMAEFLATTGYSVVGTSIAPNEIELGQARIESLRVKGLPNELQFKVSPMESVDQVCEQNAFDGVFVFEALHHAFDWRQAIAASYRCVKPGGWLLLANEPNLLHTFISYRVAKLSRTHEIGLCQRELVHQMRQCGFTEIRILAPRFNNLVSQHWIAARK